MLDDDTLRSYLTTFWGYGNPRGSVWFVGMEHGGGTSLEELHRRLSAWHERGRRAFEDLHEYHAAFGEARWTGPRPRLQPTWRRLIRTLLSAAGVEYTTDEARRFQSHDLGRLAGGHCLLELYPLPSRSVSDWRYGEWSALPELRDRAIYRREIGEKREADLRQLIERAAPAGVVFYGTTFRPDWERVIGLSFSQTSIPGVLHARRDRTVFLLTPHPIAHRVTDELFDRAGRLLAGER